MRLVAERVAGATTASPSSRGRSSRDGHERPPRLDRRRRHPSVRPLRGRDGHRHGRRRGAHGAGGRRWSAGASRRRICGTVYSGVAAGHKVLTALGLTGMPIVNVEAGCASGGAALALAARRDRAGQLRPRARLRRWRRCRRASSARRFFEPWREEAGLAVTPAYFALRAQRLHARVRGHARSTSPDVVGEEPPATGCTTPTRCSASRSRSTRCSRRRWCATRLHLYMLCSPNEGAAAVVLQRDARAGARHAGAATLRSHLPGNVLGEATPLSGLDDVDDHPARPSSRRATPTRGRHRARTISTSSSARTPTRRASCSRTRSSVCARPASRPS